MSTMESAVAETVKASMPRGKECLKEMCDFLGIKLGKKPHVKSEKLNPYSPLYDANLARRVAYRRAKEKARRKANTYRMKRGK